MEIGAKIHKRIVSLGHWVTGSLGHMANRKRIFPCPDK